MLTTAAPLLIQLFPYVGVCWQLHLGAMQLLHIDVYTAMKFEFSEFVRHVLKTLSLTRYFSTSSVTVLMGIVTYVSFIHVRKIKCLTMSTCLLISIRLLY